MVIKLSPERDVRFTNDTRIHAQPTHNISFALFDILHILPEGAGVRVLPETGDDALAGEAHEDGAAGVGACADGEYGQHERGGLDEG